ncbi:PO113 protein, partial [Herpetotheres cachinnans]|nr:PO113 protein [Herpetotheres cachinnans]
IELAAVNMAFLKFKDEPVNLVTDSFYVAGIIAKLDHSMIKNMENPFLMAELRMLWSLIDQRKRDFYVMHVQSHTDLPDPIMEGNQLADFYTMSAVVPNGFEQAKLSRSFYHQNARALKWQFQLTMTQAHSILTVCPDCQLLAPLPAKRVNP